MFLWQMRANVEIQPSCKQLRGQSTSTRIRLPTGTTSKFDVIIHKFGDEFVARGIVYLKRLPNENDHKQWILLVEDRSKEGVINALENLWNPLQTMDAADQSMSSKFLRYFTVLLVD